jgi:hypothetical protein
MRFGNALDTIQGSLHQAGNHDRDRRSLSACRRFHCGVLMQRRFPPARFTSMTGCAIFVRK